MLHEKAANFSQANWHTDRHSNHSSLAAHARAQGNNIVRARWGGKLGRMLGGMLSGMLGGMLGGTKGDFPGCWVEFWVRRWVRS